MRVERPGRYSISATLTEKARPRSTVSEFSTLGSIRPHEQQRAQPTACALQKAVASNAGDYGNFNTSPGWMIYGNAMPFAAAICSVVNPQLKAIRNRLSPDFTVYVPLQACACAV